MYTLQTRAIPVEVVEKKFSDGTEGKLVTLLQADGHVIKAWAPARDKERGELEGYELLVEVDVSGYDDYRALNIRMKLREWDGQTKRTIVEVCPI